MKFSLSFLFLLMLTTSLNIFAQNQVLAPEEFSKKLKEHSSAPVVDVRTPKEFGKWHLKNAVNIDWNAADFEKKINALDKNTVVFVYCQSGGRSSAAVKKMHELGFKKVYELSGGFGAWQSANLPYVTMK